MASGLGKGIGKKTLNNKIGSGRNGLKRHRKVLDGSGAHNKPAIRRLARRAGIKRISGEFYDEASAALRAWLGKIIVDASVYAEHARRLTVVLNDVLMALKRNGYTLYSTFALTERGRKRRRLVHPIAQTELAAAANRIELRSPAKTPPPAVITPSSMHQTLTGVQKKKESVVEAVFVRNGKTAKVVQQSDNRAAKKSIQQSQEHVSVENSLLQMSTERSNEIQQAFAAFMDSVLPFQQDSSGVKLPKLVEWAGSYLMGQKKSRCSVQEAELVLEALKERDVVMVEEDGTVFFCV